MWLFTQNSTCAGHQETPFPNNVLPQDHEPPGLVQVFKWEKENMLNLYALFQKKEGIAEAKH